MAAEAEWSETGGEIVIVDDGSTDNSLELIREFANGKNYVRVESRANGGVAAATNLGFSLSSCPFVRFIDADDIVVPGSTARLSRALAEEEAGFAYGRYLNYTGSVDGQAPPDLDKARSRRVKDPLMRMLTSQAFIPSVTLAVRDQIAGCFPLPEVYRTSQDFIMGIRFALNTRFAELDVACCWAPREAPGRLSGSKARMFHDSALLLADEWEFGRNGGWPSIYRRYAVRRAAGRASHYARRHLRCSRGHMVWLGWRKLASYLPLVGPGPETLRRIAATYQEALAAQDRYP